MTKIKEWGAMEISSAVVFALTFIVGLILLIIGLSLKQSPDLLNSNDPAVEAIATFVEITRRCLIGAGVTMLIIVIPALIGLFVPNIDAMKALAILSFVLIYLAFCVVLILAIIPTLSIPLANAYCCDVNRDENCIIDNTQTEFCLKHRGPTVAGAYLIFLGVFLMVLSMAMSIVVLTKVRKTTTTTVVVTQQPPPVVAPGQYPPQPGYPQGQPGQYPPTGQPGYPPQGQPGYPPQGQPGQYPPPGYSPQPGQYPPPGQPGQYPPPGQPGQYPPGPAPDYTAPPNNYDQ